MSPPPAIIAICRRRLVAPQAKKDLDEASAGDHRDYAGSPCAPLYGWLDERALGDNG
jgi:hypothetical protein